MSERDYFAGFRDAVIRFVDANDLAAADALERAANSLERSDPTHIGITQCRVQADYLRRRAQRRDQP